MLPDVPDGGDDADLEARRRGRAYAVPKSVVIDPWFDWEGDRPPRTPFQDTVIYETHVKGFTKPLADMPEEFRGTYAGLASDEAIGTERRSASPPSSSCPIHHIVDERSWSTRAYSNDWGYSSIGYFAPHSVYAATGKHGDEVREFKGMVKALHAPGSR